MIQNRNRGGSVDLDSRICAVLEEVSGQLLLGRPIDNGLIEAQHPELMPELGRRLRDLQLILKARQVVTEEEGEVGPVESDDADIRQLAAELKDYQILNRIHRGGQGAVYRALEISTGRSVAIKVLSGGPFATHRQRQRFLREIKLTARFQHPHIVTIYGSGIICEQPYYVMEYVAGTPITDYAIVEGLSAAQRVQLFATVVRAVGHAHKRGIIHRDLKPSNILVDPEGEPHILDFGLAKALDSAEDSDDEISIVGHVVGTLPYLSPEQALGAEVLDTRSDVYSLAVVLFELLTGEYPYEVHGDRRTVRDNIISAPPRRIASCLEGAGDDGFPAAEEIGEDLEAVMARALAKEPERRYQSADGFVADLERYLRGEAVQAKADHSLYVLRKLLWRYRLHAGIAAGFALMLTASAALVTKMWLTARRERDNARDATRLAHTTLQEVVTEIDESISSLAGGSVVRNRLLTGVEERLGQLETLVRSDAAMDDIRLALAEKRGDMAAASGRFAIALPLYIAAMPPEQPGDAVDLSHLKHRIRLELKKAECANDPRTYLDEALRLAQRVAQHAVGDADAAYLLARVRAARLNEETDAGRLAAARTEADELARLLAERPKDLLRDDGDWLALRSLLLENRATIDLFHGRGEEAHAAAREHVATAEELLRRNPHDMECRIRLLGALVELGTQGFDRKETADALAVTARAEELAVELLSLEPAYAKPKKALCRAHDKLTQLHNRLLNSAQAVVHVDAGLVLAEQLVTAAPNARAWQELLCRAWYRECGLAMVERRWEDALTMMNLQVNRLEALIAQSPDRPALRRELANALGVRGRVFRAMELHDDAMRDYLRGNMLFQQLADEQADAVGFAFEEALAMSRISTGMFEIRTEEADAEAECWLDLALAEVTELDSKGLLSGDLVRVTNFYVVASRNYEMVDLRRLIAIGISTLFDHTPGLPW
jgi:hypothetical protein